MMDFTDWPLTKWNVEMLLHFLGFNVVRIRAVRYKLIRPNIINGAEAVRHAWIHLEDTSTSEKTQHSHVGGIIMV